MGKLLMAIVEADISHFPKPGTGFLRRIPHPQTQGLPPEASSGPLPIAGGAKAWEQGH